MLYVFQCLAYELIIKFYRIVTCSYLVTNLELNMDIGMYEGPQYSCITEILTNDK